MHMVSLYYLYFRCIWLVCIISMWLATKPCILFRVKQFYLDLIMHVIVILSSIESSACQACLFNVIKHVIFNISSISSSCYQACQLHLIMHVFCLILLSNIRTDTLICTYANRTKSLRPGLFSETVIILCW